MDAVYRMGEATALEVMRAIPDPPGYSAVRATMRILETKGFLRHARRGRRYAFEPTLPRRKAAAAAIRTFLRTYCDGSIEHAVASLLGLRQGKLSDADYARLKALLDRAKEESP